MIEAQTDMKDINEDNSSPITENYLIVTLKYTFSVKPLWNSMYREKSFTNKLELN